MKKVSIIAILLVLLLLPQAQASGPVFRVDTGGDGDDTKIDGICATSAGLCSLRAAIQEANAYRGGDAPLIMILAKRITINQMDRSGLAALVVRRDIELIGTGADVQLKMGSNVEGKSLFYFADDARLRIKALHMFFIDGVLSGGGAPPVVTRTPTPLPSPTPASTTPPPSPTASATPRPSPTPSPTSPATLGVRRLVIVDGNGNVIRRLDGGEVLRLADLPDRYRLRAELEGCCIGRVKFFVNGNLWRVDDRPPFQFQGPTAKRQHTIRVVPYDVGGDRGRRLWVTYTLK